MEQCPMHCPTHCQIVPNFISGMYLTQRTSVLFIVQRICTWPDSQKGSSKYIFTFLVKTWRNWDNRSEAEKITWNVKPETANCNNMQDGDIQVLKLWDTSGCLSAGRTKGRMLEAIVKIPHKNMLLKERTLEMRFPWEIFVLA